MVTSSQPGRDRSWIALGVSVQGEDASLVAGLVSAGVGDCGLPGAAEGAGDQVADGGPGIGLVSGACPLEVFAECLVAHVVLAVLDGPVTPGVGGQVAGPGQVR